MTDQELDARKTALQLALAHPMPATQAAAPHGIESRAERFRAFLMGEWKKVEEKVEGTDAA